MLAELAQTKPHAAVPAQHAPIYRLEAELLKLPQVDMPVEHAFCAGMYARTMHIPALTVLTGAVHRHDAFFVVRKGRLAVTTDDGAAVLEPGAQVITKAGTKRAGVALTDVVVTTYHANPTEERDPVALWDLFTVPAPAASLTGHEHALLDLLEDMR